MRNGDVLPILYWSEWNSPLHLLLLQPCAQLRFDTLEAATHSTITFPAATTPSNNAAEIASTIATTAIAAVDASATGTTVPRVTTFAFPAAATGRTATIPPG